MEETKLIGQALIVAHREGIRGINKSTQNNGYCAIHEFQNLSGKKLGSIEIPSHTVFKGFRRGV